MFNHKVYYKGDTNEKTYDSDDSPSETDGCVRNLAEENENEDNKELKQDTSEINDTNESKISKGKTEEYVVSSLLAKTFSLKLIQAVIFSIDTYEQDIISVGNKKKIQSTINGIIVIICPCYHSLGKIIVYSYFIWVNVLFGLMKQKTY